MKHRLISLKLVVVISFAVIVTSVLLLGCGKAEENGQPAMYSIGAEEAKRLIDQGEVKVVDVRTEEEFAAGHIPEAALFPLNELESRLSELPKEQSYLLVCRSGNRSAQAQDILEKNGYLEVYNMTGGMLQWPYEVAP